MSEGAKLFRRIWNSLGFGQVQITDDTGTVQKAQLKLSSLETRDKTPMVQLFGFASNPPANTDAVVVFVGGDRSNGVVVATNHQPTRPTGQKSGEATIYNQFGMSIALAQDGIVINGGGHNVTITNTPTTIVQGSLAVTGNVTAQGGVTAGLGTSDMVTLQHHTHGSDTHADAIPPPTPGT